MQENAIKTEKKRNPSWFLPGNNANPNGRPRKGQALTDLMREMMDNDPNIKSQIIAALMEGAKKGDIAFIREVLDRLEGKPIQKNENMTVTDLQLSYGHTGNNAASTEAGNSNRDTVESKV